MLPYVDGMVHGWLYPDKIRLLKPECMMQLFLILILWLCEKKC
jgi:hypothetical protein